MGEHNIDEQEFREGCATLADAIMKGSVNIQQIVSGDFYQFDEEGEVIGACTMGAAYLASDDWKPGVPSAEDIEDAFWVLNVNVYWPGKVKVVPSSPPPQANELFDILAFLNDDARWTFQQIADSVRTAQRYVPC